MMNRVGCGQMCNKDESFNTQRQKWSNSFLPNVTQCAFTVNVQV